MAALRYFDINGRIGQGVYGKSDCDFPDADSLIASMDYLGIARALVWDYEARDVNPTRGNRALIEKIGCKDEFRRRLFPALSITPACVRDTEGLASVKNALETGSVKALRVFPSSPRFNIGALTLFFEKIKDCSPVVLWGGANGRAGVEALCGLAEKFGSFSFVLTELWWGFLAASLDLLVPLKNVWIDTSYLYNADAIELVTEFLGEDRIVFGTGFKSHYGASIAALAHSKVDAGVKEKIAHGNIERILGLCPDNAALKKVPLLDHKPLWNIFREGQALKDVEIVDAHGHSGPYANFGWTPASQPADVFNAIIEKMDAIGIDHMLISHIPALYGDCLEFNRELQRILSGDYKKRLSGYLAFNPHYKEVLLPQLDTFFASGVFKGIKLLADYWKVPVTDPGYQGAWEYANEHALAILLHTWEGTYSSPGMLSEIVPKYPRASFILGHAGGSSNGRKEAVSLVQNHSHVYLEFCGSFLTSDDWIDTFEQVGFDRVVFGSDADGHNQAWELGRLLSLPVPDAQLLGVLSKNIKTILSKRMD